ncbi:MAG: geranylgeranylglycerol-phosphate geranylgeranyltransferase [Candidatus Zixiibacteriota bacterium]|nr:MAG: geranylgeranylglycerol-phosphate geranylgeranyltransferase [candidate division Zixibacteria bacterium]
MSLAARRFDPSAFLVLTRPGNVALTALSVGVAGAISSPDWPARGGDLLTAMAAAALVAAGGNAYNDWRDRDLDRLQKPHRPLPAGRVSPGAALLLAQSCLIAGLILAGWVNPAAQGVALAAGITLILYSRYWKGVPLAGNLAVAFVAGLAFVFGGLAVGEPGNALWAAALAFGFHLGREIIKDMEDVPGDSAAGVGTLPVRYGLPAARGAVLLVFTLLAVLLPLPYYLGNYRSAYLAVALAGVLPVLILAAALAWRWSRPEDLHRLGVLLKWDMLAGLGALYLGRPGG